MPRTRASSTPRACAFAIVAARFNRDITEQLLDGSLRALKALREHVAAT